MRALLLALTAVAAAGCSAEPRSAAYFEAHPEETGRVLARCANGAHRGDECENARAAKAAFDAKVRQELFRRGFD